MNDPTQNYLENLIVVRKIMGYYEKGKPDRSEEYDYQKNKNKEKRNDIHFRKFLMILLGYRAPTHL